MKIRITHANMQQTYGTIMKWKYSISTLCVSSTLLNISMRERKIERRKISGKMENSFLYAIAIKNEDHPDRKMEI